MEESAFASDIAKPPKSDSGISSSEPSDSESDRREILLATLMCVNLVAMISLVALFVMGSSNIGKGDAGDAVTDELDELKRTTKFEETVSTTPRMGGSSRVMVQPMSTATPTVRAIICTVGDTATHKHMYPADYCDYLFYTEVYPKDGRIDSRRHEYSWELFQIMVARRKKFQFGISFAFDLVTPENLEESAGSLDALRSAGIRHYGLLTVLAFPVDYNLKVSNARAIIAKLKELQGSDWTAKTVLAFGTYEYSEYFMPTIKAVFTDVTNTFMADIVIAITSTGWIGFEGLCSSVPPNSIYTDNLGHTVLESHWFAVSARTTFLNPSIITGLSFELSALKYVMEKIPASLNDSVFQPCLSVKKSGREALCKHSDFKGGPKNYLGDPLHVYGVFFNTSKTLTLCEYKDSLVKKFVKAVKDIAVLRKRTAWLLYNVHNQGPSTQCPERPFTVLKLFSAALKRS